MQFIEIKLTEPACPRGPSSFQGLLRHPQIKFLMRVGLFYMFLMMFSIQMLLGHSVRSQTLDSIKVTIELNGENLKSLFNKIEKQTGLLFAYQPNQVDAYKKISIPLETRSVKATLDLVMDGTPLGYRQVNNSVIVFKKATTKNQLASNDYIQVTVSGTVTDSKGTPMPGVNIIEKGTVNGTSSDSNGKYTISVADDATLVFSFIGYKTHEVAISALSTIDVQLEEDIATLEEVVVQTNYWKTPQKLNPGNISKVDGKVMETQQISDPWQALQGRMTGVYISQNQGAPGGGFKIEIRGKNSLRGRTVFVDTDANWPLYIIDGIPYPAQSLLGDQGPLNSGDNPLNAINPDDIESIEVLKDADATAIYGSRGANGVVLITTKRSKFDSKSKVNINFSQGFSKALPRYDLLNTQQYLTMRNEAFANNNTAMNLGNAPDLLAWDQNRFTDWQEEILGGTATSTKFNTSVSGGNSNTSFLAGAGYYHEGSVLPGDVSYKKASGNLNIDHRSTNEKFTASFSSIFSTVTNNTVDALITNLIKLPPNAPAVYNENGDLNWEGNTFDNPLAEFKKKYKANTNNLINNITVGYSLLPGLIAKVSGGYNISHSKTIKLNPISAHFPESGTLGTTIKSNTSVATWIVEPQLEYEQRFGESTFKALVGTTFQETNSERFIVRATGFESDALLEDFTAVSNTNITITNSYSQYKYMAVYGRLYYDYRNKYILNLTGRRDGSSRFGPDRQFGNFGAIGAAWIFSEEDFIQDNLSFLSFGKLRASAGVTGADAIQNYAWMNTYEAVVNGNQYQNGQTIEPSGLANPLLGWEENVKLEGGLELGFINGKLTLSASYYRNRSSNQLVGRPLPSTTGFNSINDNLDEATVQNTGWEFEAKTLNISTSNLKWTTGFNISIPRNKLVSYPNIELSSYNYAYAVGKPLDVSFRYKYLGVNPQTGLYEVADRNQDGSINTLDLAPVFQGINFHGGLSNTLQYKNFQLDVLFQFVDRVGGSPFGPFGVPGSMSNQPSEISSRWQNPGDNTGIQKAYISSTTFTQWLNSDATLVDGSYIKLRNVTLAWLLPSRLLQRYNVSNCRLFIQGQNLVTITKSHLLDPETGSGIPVLTTVSVGFQLSL